MQLFSIKLLHKIFLKSTLQFLPANWNIRNTFFMISLNAAKKPQFWNSCINININYGDCRRSVLTSWRARGVLSPSGRCSSRASTIQLAIIVSSTMYSNGVKISVKEKGKAIIKLKCNFKLMFEAFKILTWILLLCFNLVCLARLFKSYSCFCIKIEEHHKYLFWNFVRVDRNTNQHVSATPITEDKQQ